MSYAHLNQYERYQIQHLHHAGFSSREIAEQVERDPSTIPSVMSFVAMPASTLMMRTRRIGRAHNADTRRARGRGSARTSGRPWKRVRPKDGVPSRLLATAKGCDLSAYTDAKLQQIEDKLNQPENG